MANQKIRIMVYRHSAFYSPLIATIAGGFLKDQGIEASYNQKPKERNLHEMFRNGEIDIMQAAPSTSWDPLSKGIRDIPVHFAQINQRDGFFITGRPTNKPFNWKQLEGARLIADHSQQPLAMLKYGLRLAGVDWKRIEVVDSAAPEAMDRAFREGSADYVHLQGPAPQELEQDGIGKVVACVGDVIPPIAFSSLMANREFLDTPVAGAFMRAYRRSLQWVNEADPEAIAAAESSFFPGVSTDALAAAIARYQQLRCWRPDPAIPRDQYELAMDVFLETGVFKERYPYEDVVVAPPE